MGDPEAIIKEARKKKKVSNTSLSEENSPVLLKKVSFPFKTALNFDDLGGKFEHSYETKSGKSSIEILVNPDSPLKPLTPVRDLGFPRKGLFLFVTTCLRGSRSKNHTFRHFKA